MAVLALAADLFFEAKIRGVANAAGIAVDVVRTAVALEERIAAASGLILDLNAGGPELLELAGRVRLARPELRMVGFLSHVQAELARQARAAGIDEVMPRSKFSENLAAILQKLAAGSDLRGPGAPARGPAGT